MTENVRKIFDMLGVEPNERFKVNGYAPLYYIDEELKMFNYDLVCEIPFLIGLLNGKLSIIKIPKKKHVGDLQCEDVDCKDCPLYAIHCFPNPDTLNVVLEKWLEVYGDKEIYEILKARLDKEVEE